MAAQDIQKPALRGREASPLLRPGRWTRGRRGGRRIALLALLGGLVIGLDPDAHAAAPTRARLCFWVPPGKAAAFEAEYRETIVPILSDRGLAESTRRGRPTADGVFSRLFDVAGPADVGRMRETLTADPIWTAVMKRLGDGFGGESHGPLRHSLELYSAPSGPGTTALCGGGRGNWRAFDEEDGLPKGTVRAIVEDAEGYLWFGIEGGGASRFDGQSYRTFTTKDGLVHDNVQTMLVAHDGSIWAGTSSGVSRYDGAGWESFRTEDGLSGNNVWTMFEDRQRRIWFGVRDAPLCRLDGETWTTHTVDGDPSSTGSVTAVYQDRDGDLWFSPFGQGILRLDGRTPDQRPGHGWTRYTTEDGLAENTVFAILQDREDALWFGTWNSGLSRFDPRVKPGAGSSASSGQAEWTTFTTRNGLVADGVRSLAQPRDGHIVIGTEAGVSHFDPAPDGDGGDWRSFAGAEGMAFSLVMSICQDREGYTWLGTMNGVARFDEWDLVTFTEADGLADNRVWEAAQDGTGRLWFGTRDGVSCYDGTSWTTFSTDDGLAGNNVWAVYEDDGGHLWFGTQDAGVSRYDPSAGPGEVAWATYTEADGLASNAVRAILQDRVGRTWFGTAGHGLTVHDPESEPAGRSWRTFTAADGLGSNVVGDLYLDREDRLWVSTHVGGVSWLDVSGPLDNPAFSTLTAEDGLADNAALCAIQDDEGRMWFGTMAGVSRFDPRVPSGSGGEAWTSYGTSDGLAGNWVLDLAQGPEGRLWIGAFGGVSHYDGAFFQSITRRDGLAENGVTDLLLDRSGDLWVSTASGGVTRYRRPDCAPPSVSVAAVVADRRYEGVAEVSVSTDVDLVAFEFGALCYCTRPEAMIYRYRLAGVDRGWQTTRQRRVEYFGLPLGRHTFEVEAVDRELVRSEHPAVVRLSVHLPYDHIGMYALLVIAVALVVWQTGRAVRRGRRLRQSNEELRREMAERERAEADRARLDAQLEQLEYLYLLRTALAEARTSDEAIQKGGAVALEALSAMATAGILVEKDGRSWRFGETDQELCCERPLVWGEVVRGRMQVFCGTGMKQTQACALLSETAAQIARTLEAQELELQLLQSARLVSLGQMAAGVAHELNQPLGAISATAEDYYLRLREGLKVSDAQWEEMLRRMVAMTERMTGTVDHLRVLSRDTSEEPSIRFSVNDVVHSSLSLMGTQLGNHGITVDLDLHDGLPAVKGHPQRLEQVFINLIGNARDAMDERGEVEGEGGWKKKLAVRTRLGDSDLGDVVAEVEDNGVGIEEGDASRVFDPFYTTKGPDRGTGLGLSISHAIIRNHSGRMACESTIGKGTIFRVWLPADG